jgi:rhamnose utilization protein RhaD (predicted bifunctional aldolase and dehydrogenase)
MDSQFNTFIQSFSNNYIEHKVTGDSKYESAYKSAREGLDKIVSQMTENVQAQRKTINDFYDSGIVQQIQESETNNRLLQRGILTEMDEIVASKMRENSPPIPSKTISTTQYIVLGVSVVTLIGLTFL